MYEYVKDNYGVPAEYGRQVDMNGRLGTIVEDRGHYIGVNFNDEKSSMVSNVHPNDVEYKEIVSVRKMTRSQKNYQEFLRLECNETFAEWMGFK